jgi:hypothetical protein
MPDYYPMFEGLHWTGYLHVIEMLHIAANLWRITGLWMLHRERQKHSENAFGAMRFLAYQFITLLDGWRTWGTELKIDVDALMKAMPGYETLVHAERFAREVAYTAEEATACQGGKPVPTAECVVAELQKAMDAWTRNLG